MKTLNFTAVEVLPSLLDKSKTQTIRTAWGRIIKAPFFSHKAIVLKPARFKVGEKVQLVWNQRSKYKWWCCRCVKGVTNKRKHFFTHANQEQDFEFIKQCVNNYPDYFNKLLGTAEITEVFKIGLGYEFHLKNSPVFSGIDFRRNVKKIDFIDLAKRDGFKSAEEMLNWFDKKYDLSQPKEFWVYRWMWVSHK